MTRVFSTIFAVLLFARPVAAFDLVLEVPTPTEGSDVKVLLDPADSEAALHLAAIYRPGSRTEKREEIGPFGPGGEIVWRPSHAGITRLLAHDPADGGATERATRNVAVRFRHPPLGGILIFLFAGGFLFGGAILAMRWALAGEASAARRAKRRGAPST